LATGVEAIAFVSVCPASATAVDTAEREFLRPLTGADRRELRRLLLDVMRQRIAWLGDA
jgi:hypothetical protein